MNYYKDNCKHFRYIYKIITGIDGSMNHVKVGSECLIDNMVNRKCPKDENCFEEVYHLALNRANAWPFIVYKDNDFYDISGNSII